MGVQGIQSWMTSPAGQAQHVLYPPREKRKEKKQAELTLQMDVWHILTNQVLLSWRIQYWTQKAATSPDGKTGAASQTCLEHHCDSARGHRSVGQRKSGRGIKVVGNSKLRLALWTECRCWFLQCGGRHIVNTEWGTLDWKKCKWIGTSSGKMDWAIFL